MRTRIFWPGIFALAGTISPVVWVANFMVFTAPNIAGDFSQFSFLLFFIPFLALVVCAFLGLSLRFFLVRDNSRHLGGILALLYGVALFSLPPYLFHSLSLDTNYPAPLAAWLLFAVWLVPLPVGLTGGIWGFFGRKEAQTDVALRAEDVVPRLAIIAGPLSTVGMFSIAGGLQSQSFLGLDLLLSLGSSLLITLGAVFLLKGWGRPRPLGILMIIGSIFPLILSLFVWANQVQWYLLLPQAPGIVSFLGAALAAILGSWIAIKDKQIRRAVSSPNS